MNPVPSAGDWLTTIWHGSAAGAGLAAEQEPHAVTADRRERWACIEVQHEAQVCRVKPNCCWNVVDHVSDAHRHVFVLLLCCCLESLSLFDIRPRAAHSNRI